MTVPPHDRSTSSPAARIQPIAQRVAGEIEVERIGSIIQAPGIGQRAAEYDLACGVVGFGCPLRLVPRRTLPPCGLSAPVRRASLHRTIRNPRDSRAN